MYTEILPLRDILSGFPGFQSDGWGRAQPLVILNEKGMRALSSPSSMEEALSNGLCPLTSAFSVHFDDGVAGYEISLFEAVFWGLPGARPSSDRRIMLDALLNKGGLPSNPVRRFGQAPIHVSARSISREDSGKVCVGRDLALLLSFGVDPNLRDSRGRTPLHLVCGSVNAEALIAAGADLGALDSEGQTPECARKAVAVAMAGREVVELSKGICAGRQRNRSRI